VAVMLADSAPAASAPEPNLSNPLLSVLGFMEALTNHCSDGRVVCSRQATVGRGSLKFLLLNPAAHFSNIVKEARYPKTSLKLPFCHTATLCLYYYVQVFLARNCVLCFCYGRLLLYHHTVLKVASCHILTICPQRF
jgi:hypothetical protein